MGLNTPQKYVLAAALTGAALAGGAYEYKYEFPKVNKAAEQIKGAAQLVLSAQNDVTTGTCSVSKLGTSGFEVFNVTCANSSYLLTNSVVGDTQCCRTFKLLRKQSGSDEYSDGLDFDQGRTDEDKTTTGKYGNKIIINSPALRNIDDIFSLSTFSRVSDKYIANCNTAHPETDEFSRCWIHPNDPEATEDDVLLRSIYTSQLKDTAAVYFDLYDNVAHLAQSQSK